MKFSFDGGAWSMQPWLQYLVGWMQTILGGEVTLDTKPTLFEKLTCVWEKEQG